jgi:hypothetical protein
MAEKHADGWVYGPTKNATTKEHPCLVPYAEMPPPQRIKDDLFRDTVNAMSRALVNALGDAVG